MLTIDKLSGLLNQTAPSGVAAGSAGNDHFQSTLLGFLQKTQAAGTAGEANGPMDKDRLMLLSRALQIQMNRHLINSVLGGPWETNALASMLLSEHPPAGPRSGSQPASKNDHIPSNVDMSKNNSSFDPIIVRAAGDYGVDVNLIRSVIKAESDFNPGATSPKGAMGLMQLMPGTARELGVQNPYDPEENVRGGVRYLKALLDRYGGQVDCALAAYNWGMGNLERNPDRLPVETAGYIDRVNRFYQKMKG